MLSQYALHGSPSTPLRLAAGKWWHPLEEIGSTLEWLGIARRWGPGDDPVARDGDRQPDVLLGVVEAPDALLVHQQSARRELGGDDTATPAPNRRWTERTTIGTRRTNDQIAIRQRDRPAEPLIGSM